MTDASDDLSILLRHAFDEPFLLALGGFLRRNLLPDEDWHHVKIAVWARRKGDDVLLDGASCYSGSRRDYAGPVLRRPPSP